ncbi:MAG: peptidylprolyl isomerase [Gammaproteobacteria bacterium]|nr:peptidylprolyl isomerase [Gammaproteobacteria bacterium]
MTLSRSGNKMITMAALLCLSMGLANAEPSSPSHAVHGTGSGDVFATVGTEKISMREFEAAYQAGIRKRFYHGKIPEDQLAAFRREISQTIIDRTLLLQEARKRGIQADEKFVLSELKNYEARYSKMKGWGEHKEQILLGLKSALEEQSVLDLFEAQIKSPKNLSDSQVKEFYRENPQLFTTPEQIRVSLILLKVDPASSPEVWQAAQDEAKDIKSRLDNGAEFSQLARIHSGDPSASNGGDMGFVHSGMLSPSAQRVVDDLKAGEVSVPVSMLRGVAIFRLEEKREKRLNEFAAVSERAKRLLERKVSEQAWVDLKSELRSRVKVSINSAAL